MDRPQIGLLETSVKDYFINNEPTPASAGIVKNYHALDIPLLQRLSRDKVGYKAPHRIVNAVRKYRYGDEASKEVEVTEGDALAFYILITDELPDAGLDEIFKRHNINRLGSGALRTMLHCFQAKDLLKDSYV